MNSPLLLGAALLFQCALLQGSGICPLGNQLHNPRRVLKVAAMLGSVTAVAIGLTALVQQLLLHPAGLDYLDTFAAVIGAALSAQVAVLILQLTQQLDHADSNTAALLIQIGVLGTAVTFNQATASIAHSAQQALLAGSLFALLYVLLAALRERLELSDVPQRLRGTAIHLISAGLVALALMGFAGFV
jgi:electron transport complex protein RnfA